MATISSARTTEGADITKVMGSAASLRLNEGAPYSPKIEDIAEISPQGMQQSAIAALSDAAKSLLSGRPWSSTQVTSEISRVAAVSSNGASVGDYQIAIDQIASGQITTTSSFFPATPVIGLGTLNIEMGSWDPGLTTFAPNPNWPKAAVVLGPRNDSLDIVRDKINAAGIGVTATVVSDATGSRLVLRSTNTGLNNGFKVTTDEAPETARSLESATEPLPLSALAFDPSSATKLGMALLQPASDARVQVNDKTIESPLNAIESETGLNLTLKGTTDGPVKVSVSLNQDGAQSAIQDFARAYNSLLRQGGNTAESVRAATQSALVTPDQQSESSRALTKIGISIAGSGELKIRTSRLNYALQQDPEAVRKNLATIAKQVLSALPQDQANSGLEPGSSNQTDANSPSGSGLANAGGSLIRQRLLAQYQEVSSELESKKISANAPSGNFAAQNGIGTL